MNIDDVDAALERLARAALPARLHRLEAVVLDRVALDRPGRPADTFRFSAIAAAAALIMGVVGGTVPWDEGRAHASLTPLTGASELAPSSLLAGHE